jgi:biopolymer transport protein ExbB
MASAYLQASQSLETLNQGITGAPALPVGPVADSMTIMDILVKGGILMIPILILSIVAVYIFAERYFTIRRYVKADAKFMDSILEYIRLDKVGAALNLCRNTAQPIARMIEKGVMRIGKPIKEIEESIEIAGKFEIYEMEKNIQILAVIASIAPMFGFLGTIIGVIKIFHDISLTSDVSIGSVSAGLYTKMVTSCAGLTVGVLAFIGYHWLKGILNKAIHQMEWSAMNFIELLNEPSK